MLVLASGRGDELASEDMLAAIRELLIPQTTIITPNSIEARRLCEDEGDDGEGGSHRSYRTAHTGRGACAARNAFQNTTRSSLL